MQRIERIDDDDYEIKDGKEDEFQKILTSSSCRYPSVLFQVGEVKLKEENDSLRVIYEYEIFDNPNRLDTESQGFKDFVGNIVMNNLEDILSYNQLHKG